MIKILSIERIITNPDIRHGRPIIQGTGICVADIATVKIYHQQDADQLAEWFDLPLEDVYAALSYYYAHKAEIDADIVARDALAQQAKENRFGQE